MSKQSQTEIDQMIQRAQCSNRDLVRRDIIQSIQSSQCNLILNFIVSYSNERISRGSLCLSGTVVCQYKGNRYNIPVEIHIHPNHPYQSPTAKVKPTSNMFISPNNQDVQSDGTFINQYLRTWRHPNSDLCSLINSMSQSFSQMPPVYSGSPVVTQTTPYPTNLSTMPMPMPMPMVRSSPVNVYPGNENRIPNDIYRESIRSAVLDKVSNHYSELIEIKQGEINCLKNMQDDLNARQTKIELLINNIREQQSQIKNYLTSLTNKTNQKSEKEKEKEKESSIQEDAIVISKPIFNKLFQCYIEDHAIQDLLYYLADGLKREAISLESYLKHVTKLSRKQFLLRATMNKCRQISESS